MGLFCSASACFDCLKVNYGSTLAAPPGIPSLDPILGLKRGTAAGRGVLEVDPGAGGSGGAPGLGIPPGGGGRSRTS